MQALKACTWLARPAWVEKEKDLRPRTREGGDMNHFTSIQQTSVALATDAETWLTWQGFPGHFR